MTDTEDVKVEVQGEDIIITAFGTDHLVIYSRREDSVELRAKKLFGPLDFRLRAWTLANQKAQELGWLGCVRRHEPEEGVKKRPHEKHGPGARHAPCSTLPEPNGTLPSPETIDNQYRTIAKLENDGQDTEAAVERLKQFIEAQEDLKQDRDWLLSKLADTS